MIKSIQSMFMIHTPHSINISSVFTSKSEAFECVNRCEEVNRILRYFIMHASFIILITIIPIYLVHYLM